MKASNYIADYLAFRGVPAVFELVGGMITHMVDSLHERGAVRIVSMHHEQAAAFAADAMGRLTGIPGVAMATSGPGATNLLTGIGSCYFDSSPAVFITGQVNRAELKGNRPIRQLGFQETDIVSMAAPITKCARLVLDPAELPKALADAFDLAVSGRPGPVLLDIPMDIQRSQVDGEFLPLQALTPLSVDAARVEDLLARLASAERPLILAGGGVRASNSGEALRRFVEHLGIPLVYSLNAVDVLPYAHPLRVGMLGSYGNRWANLAIGEADFVLVLGSRLDIRQTGADTASWKGDRTIVQVDCEEGEINQRVSGCESIVADLREFFEIADTIGGGATSESHAGWLRRLGELRSEWCDTHELSDIRGINPNVFLHELSSRTPWAGAFVADVGQHQMWAAQSIEIGESQRFLTSGGMGSMGFALPAAIGSAVATGKPVILVAGDGGFQCNIQELQTVVRNQLPIKLVILNNRCHGMVRQFQESYFGCRYQSTVWGYDAPNFEAVANAYGIPARTIESPDAMNAGLDWLCDDPGKPALLQVMIDTETNVYPKIAFGRPMTEMEPFAKPLEMEST